MSHHLTDSKTWQWYLMFFTWCVMAFNLYLANNTIESQNKTNQTLTDELFNKNNTVRILSVELIKCESVK